MISSKKFALLLPVVLVAAAASWHALADEPDTQPVAQIAPAPLIDLEAAEPPADQPAGDMPQAGAADAASAPAEAESRPADEGGEAVAASEPASRPATSPASLPASMPGSPAATEPAEGEGEQGAATDEGVVREVEADVDESGQPDVSDGGMVMNFADAPLGVVLREMSEKLGLVVINPDAVSARISVVSRRPLSAGEAVDTLNVVLKESGYTAIRSGRNLKIVTLSDAKVSNVPVRSGNDPSRISDSEEMVTQVIPIRYAEAQRLTQDLGQLIPSYAHLTSNVASNTLIYTATEADVRHLVEIVRSLDVQLADADTVRVFPLRYADATATARLITDIFNQAGTTGTSNQRAPGGFGIFGAGFQSRPGRGGRGGGGNQGGEEQSGASVRQQRVVASGDSQTNAVVVSAPPELMALIADVIESLDANPVAEETIFVYPLSNAKAADLEGVLQDIFSESTNTTTGRGGAGGRGGFTARGGVTAPRGAAGSQTGLSATARDAAADLAGKVYIVAEESTNSLLVRTAARYWEQVQEILKELDRPTRQVLIKVLIAEITHDNNLDVGTEFSVLNLHIGSGTAEVKTDFGLAGVTSGLVTAYSSTDFEATIRALETVGKLDVLSRPYLLASENQEASITVGSEVPFITNSRVSADTGQTVNTVEYRDIGIILTVTPYIGPDGMVIMDVDQEVTSLTGQTVTVSEDFDAEIYAKRSAITRIAVGNGKTAVIGGLMEDRITDTIRKVPLLGDIPILGALFSRTIHNKNKTELLIFLCPQTALTPAELATVSKGVRDQADELVNTIVPGSLDKAFNELTYPIAPPAEGVDDGVPQPQPAMPDQSGAETAAPQPTDDQTAAPRDPAPSETGMRRWQGRQRQ